MLMRSWGFVSCVVAAACLVLAVSGAGGAEDPRLTAALKLWNESRLEARRPVLRKLRRLGPRAAPAVEALKATLSDSDPKLRAEVATTLGRIGPAAGSAVPELLAALGDPIAEVRDAAARALAELEPDPSRVIPALVSSLRAGPDRRCLEAMAVLSKLGAPAVPALIGLVQDDDAELRARAVEPLLAIGPEAKPSISVLIDGLRWPDPEVREVVAGVLAAIGPNAVEPLIAALDDCDPRVRGGAVKAMEFLGEAAKKAAPALLQALFEDRPLSELGYRWRPDPGQWQPTASGYHMALAAIGEAAIPLLLARLDQVDRPAKIKILQTLGQIGFGAKSVVPRLVALLDDPELRVDVATALGGFGSSARAAIPRLKNALHDPDARFRTHAALALGRMGVTSYGTTTLARDLEATLTSVLTKDPDPGVRASAVSALGILGPETAPALTALVALLRDPSVDLRLTALRALARTQKRRVPDVIAIAECVTDADPRICLAAIEAIADDDLALDGVITQLAAALRSPVADVRAAAAVELSGTGGQYNAGAGNGPNEAAPGGEAGPALAARMAQTLRQALADSDPRVRTAILYAMPSSPSDAAATVPIVAAGLKDESPTVRLAAAEVLSRLGSEARAAIPALLEALDDTATDERGFSCGVAAKAAETLQKIGLEGEAPMVDRLLEGAGHVDVTGQDRAVESLGELQETTTARLLGRLADPETPRITKHRVLNLIALRSGLSGPQLLEAQAALRPALEQALPSVRVLSRDDDDRVRTDARWLLAAQARQPRDLARLILDTAREEDPVECNAFLMQAINALEPPASGVLLEGLKDPDDEVRTVACQAIAALARNLPDPGAPVAPGPIDEKEARQRVQGLRHRVQLADALLSLLNDPDTQVRWAAATGLYCLRSGERSVPALLAMAGDRTTRLRHGARVQVTWCLGGGNNVNEAKARGELVRLGAIQALGGFAAAAAPAVPLLIDELTHGDAISRSFAMNALGQIGPAAKPAVEALAAQLHRKDDPGEAAALRRLNELRGWALAERSSVFAARALAAIGPDASAAVPALIEALSDPDPSLRRAAAQTLGSIGPAAQAAAPALVAQFADPYGVVGSIAAEALGSIGAAAVPTLVEALLDRDTSVRQLAIEALSRAGAAATSAVPDLLRALADPDEEIRVPAAEALGQVARGSEVEPAIAGLTAALEDSEPVVRKSAQRAITTIRDAEP